MPLSKTHRRHPSKLIRALAEILERRQLLTALVINGTGGNDTITVSATGIFINVTVNGSTTHYSDPAFDSIQISGQGGNDTVNLNSDSNNPTSIDGGGDAGDVANIGNGNLDNITSLVTTNFCAVNLRDHNSTGNWNYSSAWNANPNITRGGLFAGVLAAQGYRGINIYGGGGNNTFYVTSGTNAISVYGGNGNDTYYTGPLGAPYPFFDGGGGYDSAIIDESDAQWAPDSVLRVWAGTVEIFRHSGDFNAYGALGLGSCESLQISGNASGGGAYYVDETQPNQNIVINGGAGNVTNDFTLLGAESGASITLNGGAGSDYFADLLDPPPSGGPGRMLTLNGVGGDNSFFLSNRDSQDTVHANGGDGNDTFQLGDPVYTNSYIPSGTLYMDGGDGTNYVNIYQTGQLSNINYTGGSQYDQLYVYSVGTLSSLTADMGAGGDFIYVGASATACYMDLSGGLGADTITCASTNGGLIYLEGGDGADLINVLGADPTASVNVLGGNGDDTVRIGVPGGTVSPIASSVSVYGHDGTDTLEFHDDGTTIGNNYAVAGDFLTRNGTTIANFDSSTENAVIYTGSGNNSLTFGNGTLDGIDVPWTYHGNSGIDSLTVDDSASAYTGSYYVTGQTTTRGSAVLNYEASLDSYALYAARGDNAITVAGAPGQTLDIPTINGGNGNDTITISTLYLFENAYLHGIPSAWVDGGAGTNTLLVDASADTQVGDDGRSYYGINPGNVNQAFVQNGQFLFRHWFNYSSMSNVALYAGNMPNTIWLTDNTPGVSMTVRGGSSADQILPQQTAPGLPALILSSAGNDTVNVNDDGGPAAAVRFNATQHLASLTIYDGGVASVDPGSNAVLVMPAFSVYPSAKLDLNDNDMLYQSAGPADIYLNALQAWINSARHQGAWDGYGITSTSAKTNPSHNTTLGAITGKDFRSVYGNGSVFDGETVDNNSVLIKYTYYGDTDFNGRVDGADYARIDNKFNQQVTQGNIGGWFNGDFDYNGKIDGADYALIDLAFNSQGAVVLRHGNSTIAWKIGLVAGFA